MARFRRTIGGVVVLALAVGLGPAVAQDSIDDARQQREDARVEQLRAEAALDVLNAEFEDVQAAFAAADELVTMAENRAAAVRAQLELAEISKQYKNCLILLPHFPIFLRHSWPTRSVLRMTAL